MCCNFLKRIMQLKQEFLQTLDHKLDSQVEKILGKKQRPSHNGFGSGQLDANNDPVQNDFEET